MPPPGKKRPRRTPDGRPEMRGPDQILRDAAADISHDLPTKGTRLDLDAYFRSGEEHRMANKILKDNGVLPLHLQDRKEAEDHREAGERELAHQRDRLEDLRREIAGLVGDLSADFEVPEELVTVHPPSPDDHHARGRARKARGQVEALAEKIRAHDLRRETALTRYGDALRASNDATERYNRHIASTGRLLPPYPAEALIDVDRRVREAETTLPAPYDVPADEIDSLRNQIRRAGSIRSRLRKLVARGTRI